MLKDYALSLTALAFFFLAYTGLLFWQNSKRLNEPVRASASVSSPELPEHFKAIEAGRAEP